MPGVWHRIAALGPALLPARATPRAAPATTVTITQGIVAEIIVLISDGDGAVPPRPPPCFESNDDATHGRPAHDRDRTRPRRRYGGNAERRGGGSGPEAHLRRHQPH